MTNPNSISPAVILDETDPGDDTQRRYRYQAAYSAILSLELLRDAPDCEFREIFCEHHEDTLIHLADGSFVGVQVKTRQPGRELFKADDEQIITALKRFLDLYLDHPGHFSRFVIATNYAFWRERETAESLPHIIELSRGYISEISGSVPRKLSTFAKKITDLATISAGISSPLETMLQVLKITELQDDLPKFDDVEVRIARMLPDFYECGDACLDDLTRAARALISRMIEAASLSHVSSRQLYFAACREPHSLRIDNTIAGKRILKSDVTLVLSQTINAAPTILQENGHPIANLPQGTQLLELKMTAGRISAMNIRRAKDHKFSMEYLLQVWLNKYGAKKAQQRFDQLNVIVATECQEAYDQALKQGQDFGQTMLEDVRRRLRQRLNAEPSLFFDCRYEHILGMAAILTDLCEIWWSEVFEIPKQVIT